METFSFMAIGVCAGVFVGCELGYHRERRSCACWLHMHLTSVLVILVRVAPGLAPRAKGLPIDNLSQWRDSYLTRMFDCYKGTCYILGHQVLAPLPR
jgi:hypothetical protein